MNTIRCLLPLGIVYAISFLPTVISAAPVQAEDAIADEAENSALVLDERVSPGRSPGTEVEPTTANTPETELSCPLGQFSSAFADVPPNHWAYTAVNRLASAPIECFEFAPT